MKTIKIVRAFGIFLTKFQHTHVIKYFLLAGCLLLYTLSTAQPTITSLSATHGIPGSSITITGTNFDATTTNNIVHFGATHGTVTAASTTSLTVTIPTGASYAPLSVRNMTTGLCAYTPYPFQPDFDESPYIADTVSFDPVMRFDSGWDNHTPTYKTADIDGDGRPDLIARGNSSWSVCRNRSAAGTITPTSLGSEKPFVTSGMFLAMAVADMDGDGKFDVITTSGFAMKIDIFRNTSVPGAEITSGSFATPFSISVPKEPAGIAVADMDNDGKPDLVCTVIDYSGNKFVAILRNTSIVGTLSFSPVATFALDGHYVVNQDCVAVGDIDGDALPDVVVGNYDLGKISILHNTSTSGSISLGPRVDFIPHNKARQIEINDIDGDGKMDISVLTFNNSISIFRNVATSGSLTASSLAPRFDIYLPTVYSTYTLSYSMSNAIAMGDLDGDCRPDIVVGTATHFAAVYLNNSTPGIIDSSTFRPYIRLGVSDTSTAMVAAATSVSIVDFDADTKPDILLNADSTTLTNAVVIFKNNPIMLPVTGRAQISPITDNVLIYPNPACQQLHLQWPQQAAEAADITISNLTGHTMYSSHIEMNSSNETSIDISSFANGLYVVTIKTATMKHNSKLLIQH